MTQPLVKTGPIGSTYEREHWLGEVVDVAIGTPEIEQHVRELQRIAVRLESRPNVVKAWLREREFGEEHAAKYYGEAMRELIALGQSIDDYQAAHVAFLERLQAGGAA